MNQKSEQVSTNSSAPHSILKKIIGIGASAGGLNPIKELVGNLPADIKECAIIIAQHVSPNYKSMLVELIARETELQVREVQNGANIEVNAIYTTPPDNNITLENGKFVLSRPSKTMARPSIDLLFQSLADSFQQNCTGIILSGTGKDGTKGIAAIKEAGGITIAQEPSTAKYDSMPQTAIDSGKVDFILPPGIIGSELMHILSDPESYYVEEPTDEDTAGVGKVLSLLTERIGTDVKGYKTSTINRRLEKRLKEKKFNSIDKYVAYIEEHPQELDGLFESLLIGVTKFFRDSEAFQRIRKVIQGILDRKEKGDIIRLWVPGCASGEEAYTYAIILHEFVSTTYEHVKIQIFATDIDQKALSKARKGIYGRSAVENVPLNLKNKYFTQHGEKYELSKVIRKLVLFSKHDLTSNPPFLKLDLISCRNLLIYFNAALQSQVIPVFHYALNPNGYLFLGKSEGIGHFKSLFAVQDFKHKIFKKKTGEEKVSRFPYLKPLQFNGKPKKGMPESDEPLTVAGMVKETLYNSYEHPYVVVDENLDLVEINGELSHFLQLKSGTASMNVLKLIIQDLQIELRAVLGNVIRKSKTETSNLRKVIVHDKDVRYVRLIGKPVLYSQHHNPLYLLIFEDLKLEKSFISSSEEIQEKADNPRLLELEHELAATKEHMNTLVEELETSNEELQALNEELQASNEELQASNEELETANEELQTTNEELENAYESVRAGKAEIEKQNEIIRQSENNIKTLLNNTLQAFVLLDKNYQIVTFNKTAFSIFQRIFGKGLQKDTSYVDYIPSSEFEGFQEGFQRALQGELVFSETQVKSTILDRKIWLDFNYTPVLDEKADDIEHISVSFMDRTQDKNTLNERNAFFKELQERNRELSEVNAYLENFVHVIAHDMRSPVANLKYLVDVFTSMDEEGKKQYVPLIKKSINKLDNTLKGLVQIIDVQGNQAKDAIEAIDVGQIVAEVLEEQQEKISETGAQIEVDNQLFEKISYIRGYLESILRNLISNAIKYSKSEVTPKVDISLKHEHGFVLISVQDNGIGMDLKKNQDELFIPFKRMNKDIPGLGIGLHIIKTMVEKNGGKIEVESEVGKGSVFTAYLKEYQ